MSATPSPGQTRLRMEQAASTAKRYRQHETEARDIARARTAPVLADLAARLGVEDIADVPHVITPHVAPDRVRRPRDELMAFIRHLTDITDFVFAGHPVPFGDARVQLRAFREAREAGRDVTPPAPVTEAERAEAAAQAEELDAAFAERDRHLPDDPMALVAACIACGGNCCTTGLRHHAYLGPLDIAYYRRRHPEATPAGIIADYLSRMPEKSLERSCSISSKPAVRCRANCAPRPCMNAGKQRRRPSSATSWPRPARRGPW